MRARCHLSVLSSEACPSSTSSFTCGAAEGGSACVSLKLDFGHISIPELLQPTSQPRVHMSSQPTQLQGPMGHSLNEAPTSCNGAAHILAQGPRNMSAKDSFGTASQLFTQCSVTRNAYCACKNPPRAAVPLISRAAPRRGFHPRQPPSARCACRSPPAAGGFPSVQPRLCPA